MNGFFVPIAGEYPWRGIIESRLSRALPAAVAIAVTATLCSLKHVAVDASRGRFLTLVAFGGICGLLASRTTRSRGLVRTAIPNEHPFPSKVETGPMKRFNCPSCGRSLWLRLLRFDSLVRGQFRFSCSYCGTALTYSAPQPLVESPRQGLTGARLRAVLVLLAGFALFSAIAAIRGRAFALATIAAVALVLIGRHLYASAPAYRIADRESPSGDATP